MTSKQQTRRKSGSVEHYDVVIIGAGVSGMYELHHCIYYANKMAEADDEAKQVEGKALLRRVFDELERRGMKGSRPASIR